MADTTLRYAEYLPDCDLHELVECFWVLRDDVSSGSCPTAAPS